MDDGGSSLISTFEYVEETELFDRHSARLQMGEELDSADTRVVVNRRCVRRWSREV
ncbi:MAG: hypothetical protein ACRD6W_16205 [Nitrososphaerales archaeon]